MKLVGATKWFIMKPFLGSSITQGILAGVAGLGCCSALAVYGLNEAVPELTTIAESGKIAIILGAMIVGRHRHIGALHRRGPQQIRQHEVEQDIPLLNEKSE